MIDWIREHETIVTWSVAASIIMFIGSLIVVPILIARMDADYFMPDRPKRFANLHPVLHLTGLVLKNLVGVVLLLLGIIMLFVPGQGLLTILAGFMMLNFPGKKAAELRLIRYTPLNRTINWVRAKAHKPPLNLPPLPRPNEP